MARMASPTAGTVLPGIGRLQCGATELVPAGQHRPTATEGGNPRPVHRQRPGDAGRRRPAPRFPATRVRSCPYPTLEVLVRAIKGTTRSPAHVTTDPGFFHGLLFEPRHFPEPRPSEAGLLWSSAVAFVVTGPPGMRLTQALSWGTGTCPARTLLRDALHPP